MTTTTHVTRPTGSLTGTPDDATPARLGIGARFSLHPHTGDFVDVIFGALADAADAGLTDGLVLETDDVSTYVGAVDAPAEQRIVGYLAGVLAAASRRTGGGHVVAHVLLSRGCPGEVTCDLTVTGLPAAAPVEIAPTGVAATAQWSLYPLLDGGSDAGSHMAPIEAAIERARARGTATGSVHYATRLTGDIAEVLATAADAWAEVGAHVPHVVTHLTVSVGSPSPAGA
ncbi:YkoF family thiamine/hydroxymethylpyrimidine-binding protein [Cellulomonas sp. ATA003]|uniref:YkoF family thiamine/hydroxymethylpyrimidine-binding protein n=1 Tax=Cellulomonas sp. ATA003 TaxID=3073064 RepID=UPI002873E371|nr:YkoF family thiamine/hydroxymethylpyrimidine-binding protein [Cellulomonas sp. ATA003]WNB86570.1 YkoF family thiamine/hydroxymethylpyrimidine-binding protein [Cellulomonas sp. ATA003]